MRATLFRTGPVAMLASAAVFVAACSSGSGQGPGFGSTPEPDASMPSGEDGSSGSLSDGGGQISLGDTGTSSGGMGTGNCKDGTYSGTFQCTFVFNPDAGAGSTASADAGGLMITGTISFNLTQMTGNGESFIDTASGSFSGTAATFFAISADVGGTLNCNSGVFKGNLTNGMYSGFLFINGTFSGPLDSQYNGTTFTFVDGSWLLTVPGEGSCPGTWTAAYAGDAGTDQ
jgi:hypothetical protein